MKRKSWSKKEWIRKERMQRLSRRQFLSRSMVTGAGLVSAPPLVRGLFQEVSAFAEGGPLAVGIPVVQFHLPGGPGSLNSPRPTADGVNALSTTTEGRYGVNPQTVPLVTLFGNEWYKVSSTGNGNDFIDGVLSSFPPANPRLSRVIAVRVAVNSQDDNGTNPCGETNVFRASQKFQPAKLLDAVGLTGSETGLNNNSAFADKSPPFVSGRASDIVKMRNYAMQIPADPTRIGAIANTLDRLAGIFSSSQSDTSFASRIQDAHKQNLAFISPTIPDLDPKVQSTGIVATTFGITAANNDGDEVYRFATGLAYLLNGDVNFLGENREGQDYHQNPIATTRAVDNRNGIRVGQVMRCALELQKNVMIVLTQDGAVDGPPDHTAPIVANGDRGGQAAFTMLLVLGDPGTNATQLMKQLGKVKTNATADDQVLASKNDLTAASVIAANILHLNGVSNEDIAKMMSSVFRDAAEVAANLAFKLG